MPCVRTCPKDIISLTSYPASCSFRYGRGVFYGRILERWMYSHDFIVVLFQESSSGRELLLKVPQTLVPWVLWNRDVGIAQSEVDDDRPKCA